jgi:hypothetical protein
MSVDIEAMSDDSIVKSITKIANYGQRECLSKFGGNDYGYEQLRLWNVKVQNIVYRYDSYKNAF